jgi:signal transduction histidine kinase
MASYDKAIELAPDDPMPWVQLGRLLLLDLERPADARGALKEALRLQPDNQGALWMLALSHLRLGQHEESLKELNQLLDIDPTKAKRELAKLKQTARCVLQELRQAVSELRQMENASGLTAAMEEYAAAVAPEMPPEFRISARGRETGLEPAIAGHVYAAWQECVANSLKHAAANHITTRIKFTARRLIISVCDDGAGFDVEQALAKAAGEQRFGLVGMRERIELCRGKLKIRSIPGRGTRILIVVPLRPTGEAAYRRGEINGRQIEE